MIHEGGLEMNRAADGSICVTRYKYDAVPAVEWYDELSILKMLEFAPLTAKQLQLWLGIPRGRVMRLLRHWERAGKVVQMTSGEWARNKPESAESSERDTSGFQVVTPDDVAASRF